TRAPTPLLPNVTFLVALSPLNPLVYRRLQRSTASALGEELLGEDIPALVNRVICRLTIQLIVVHRFFRPTLLALHLCFLASRNSAADHAHVLFRVSRS